jgi:hypothetical protein
MTGLIPRPHRPRLAVPQRRFGDYVRERRQAKRIGLRALYKAQIALADRSAILPGMVLGRRPQ